MAAPPMTITVNGEERRVPSGLTARELLDHLGIRGAVALERNGVIVPRAAHGITALADGDALEIVQLVGGG